MPELSFDIYCKTCRMALGSLTKVERGNIVYVDVCDGCMDIKDDEINDLENEVARLEDKLSEKD